MQTAPTWLLILQQVAPLGFLATAVIALIRFRADQERNQDQKKRELEKRSEATAIASREFQWKQSVHAQSILDKLETDPLAFDAMMMLDWDGRKFPSKNPKFTVQTDEMIQALRTDDTYFNEKEVYIRDCFDRLFWYFERMNHQMSVEMLTSDHVKFPLQYVVGLMLQKLDTYERYMKEYRFEGALELVEKYRATGVTAIATPHRVTYGGDRSPASDPKLT